MSLQNHHRNGKRFAETFIATLLSWRSKSAPRVNINAQMHIGASVSVFVFTKSPKLAPYSQSIDVEAVRRLVLRASEIESRCNPLMGDLAVFDGRRILMFRRFDESLSTPAAIRAANEVAGYILMSRRPSHGEQNRKEHQ